MRQIVLDTETTGISPEAGHRIIEIGCVELFERKLTRNTFHTYLNPQRAVEEGAFRVHGISTEFLRDKPLFADVLSDFLAFVSGAELIIHNAPFDTGFINSELTRLKHAKKIHDLCTVCDTLVLARDKHPGQRNSLDALCKRYDIDNSNRQLHGALLDAEILALVYLAMTGGQASFFDSEMENSSKIKKEKCEGRQVLCSNSPVILPDDIEMASHLEFVQFLIKKSGINLWPDNP